MVRLWSEIGVTTVSVTLARYLTKVGFKINKWHLILKVKVNRPLNDRDHNQSKLGP